MAGYSKTPLAKKLGFRADAIAALIDAPADFRTTLGELPPGVTIAEAIEAGSEYDIILLFAKSRADLERRFGPLSKRLRPAGGFWIAWPKKASRVETDLTEDRVREIGLAVGLVDNKVCAIDEIWSGLRFVFRLRDRPK
jgi:hypothetical protein